MEPDLLKMTITRKILDLLTDERSRQAVEAAERFARGEHVGDVELTVARAVAWAAAMGAGEAAWTAREEATLGAGTISTGWWQPV